MNAIKDWIFGYNKEMAETKISSKHQLKQALAECRYFKISDVERDILEAVATFKDLKIIVDTYVSNMGVDQKLVCLAGTIPVNYKGKYYNIPMRFWLSLEHPALAPLVQVTPTLEMLIKVGPNIDKAGMVTVPYLHQWDKDKSDLSSLIQILCAVFSENTPVYTRQQKPTTDSLGSDSASKSRSRGGSPQTTGRVSPGAEAGMERTSSIGKKETWYDAPINRREALLHSVNDLLTRVHVIAEQAESMTDVLKMTKSELINGQLDTDRIDAVASDIERTKGWYEKVDANLLHLGQETQNIVDEAEEFKSMKSENKTKSMIHEKSYKDWNNDDVCCWFDSIGMAEFIQAVKDHKIKGIHLPNLSKEDLIELGVTKLGERMTIDDEIGQLCNTASNIF